MDKSTVYKEQGLPGQENDTMPDEEKLEENEEMDLTSEGSASSVVFPAWFEDDELPGKDKKEEQAVASSSPPEGECWHQAAPYWHERMKEQVDWSGGVPDAATFLYVDELNPR